MDIIFIFIITFIIFVILSYLNKEIFPLLLLSIFINWIIYTSIKIYLSYIDYNFFILSLNGCVNCTSFSILEGDEIILYWNSISKSLNNFSTILYNSEIFSSGFYTSLISILYKTLSNTSYHVAIGLNIILTLISIIYFFRLTNIYLSLFNSKIITLLYILYPFFYYYNSVFLRDTIIISLFTISFYYFVISIRTNIFRYKIYFLLLSLFSSFLHVANLIYFFTGFILYIYLLVDLLFSKYLKKNIKNLLYSLFLTTGILSILLIYFLNYELISNYRIPKLGYINDINFEYLFSKMNIYKQASASQPIFLNINNIYEFFYKSPLKFFYFTYAPFPWEIESIKHFFGFIDSIILFILSLIIIINFNKIFFKKEIVFVLLLILPIYFTYAVFGSNFGTNMRHRIKFFHVFLFLSSFGIVPIMLYAEYYFKKIYHYLSEKKNIINY